MHPLQLQHLTLLMQEQRSLAGEIQAYSSALSEPDLTIDEATGIRFLIDHVERVSINNQHQLNEYADRGFLGHASPGGLTKLFYGYDSIDPPAHSPGTYTRHH